MDIKQIQDLIRFVSKSGVNEVAIEQENFKITIKTNQEPTYVTASVPVAAPAPAAPQTINIAADAPAAAPSLPAAAPSADTSKYITVKSPMIGTFYRSSGPDKAPFVNVGDEINAGKPVCIIEAMKLFNEIESDVKGKIVKVLVNDATPVEYDQPLFLVEPM